MLDYEDLAQMKLFDGIQPHELTELLACVSARQSVYAKDEFIIEQGECVSEFGVVLCGNARVVKLDASGKMLIVLLLQKGSEIGVLLAASKGRESSVFIQAVDEVKVLWISYNKLAGHCESACPKHEVLLRNYIAAVAQKGLMLHERLNCLIRPTVRDKVFAYLREVSREKQSKSFDIPFDRNEMAEYLNVERSALSRELSAMKREGLIDYYKNSFKLLK